jgi:zinc protease
LLVLNQILGGQFTSRLNTRLREEKGLTYGAHSHFDFRRGPGPFVVSASVQSDRVAEALGVIVHELAELLEGHPPTAAELADARRSLIEGQAHLFETPSSLVGRYAGLFVHGLPPDHHARFPERLEAVTLEGLREAAARHLRPNELVAVVVADAAQVAGSLAQLSWADLQQVADDPEAEP